MTTTNKTTEVLLAAVRDLCAPQSKVMAAIEHAALHPQTRMVPEAILEDNGSYSAEASDLGWKPGEWPEEIHVRGHGTYRRTNIGGDGATYRQVGNMVALFVFND